MISTGLTDIEKETLLKLFLTWSALRQDDDGSYTFTMCQLSHLDKGYADLIVKAKDNLRNTELGF